MDILLEEGGVDVNQLSRVSNWTEKGNGSMRARPQSLGGFTAWFLLGH